MLKPLLLFILLTSLSEAAQSVDSLVELTPESAITNMLIGNRDLLAAHFAVRQAEARLKQSGQWPNPELEFSRQSDWAFGNQGEHNLSTGFKQRFPITGRLLKAKSVARVDVAMAISEVRNQERLLAGEVLGLSRGLLVTDEKLRANQAIKVNIQKLVEVSEKRFKVAEVSAADVNLGRIELQKLELGEATLLNQQEVSMASLNRLLGRAPQTPMRMTGLVVAVLSTNDVIEISSRALSRRPDRQLAVLGIDKAKAELILAKAQKWDDWTVGFDYSRSVGKFDAPIGTKTDNFLGLSVSVPLPLWNRNQGRVSETVATRQRAEAELSALDFRIISEISTADNQMRRLFEILRKYREESIKLAEENILLLQKGYADGLVSITPVIQAQQQLKELREASLDTLTDFFRAKTEWETATAHALLLK